MFTRGALLAAVALAAIGIVGCAPSPSVVVISRSEVTAALPAGDAPVSAVTSTVAPATVPPPTTAPPTTIASRSAHLDELPAPTGIVPIAVVAHDGDISGPVVPTGVNSDTGELALPEEAAVVAWYQYGPAPGAGGSAVLAGHVDWHGVPGIFFRLRDLQPGDSVDVTMSDGSLLRWSVVDVTLVAKPELPVSDVFTRSGPPTLTLITCGGSFDYSTHHYRSNVVVTAVPAPAPT